MQRTAINFTWRNHTWNRISGKAGTFALQSWLSSDAKAKTLGQTPGAGIVPIRLYAGAKVISDNFALPEFSAAAKRLCRLKHALWQDAVILTTSLQNVLKTMPELS